MIDPLRSHRDALGRAVGADECLELVTEAADLSDLSDGDLQLVDCVLIQTLVPGLDVVDGLERIRRVAPRCRTILCLAWTDHDLVAWGRAHGAHAVTSANVPLDALLAALCEDDAQGALPPPSGPRGSAAEVAAVRLGITDREMEILRRLSDGDPPQRIAHEIGRSVETVRDHLRSLRAKMDCSTAVELVITAHRLGLVPALGHPRPQPVDHSEG